MPREMDEREEFVYFVAGSIKCKPFDRRWKCHFTSEIEIPERFKRERGEELPYHYLTGAKDLGVFDVISFGGDDVDVVMSKKDLIRAKFLGMHKRVCRMVAGKVLECGLAVGD